MNKHPDKICALLAVALTAVVLFASWGPGSPAIPSPGEDPAAYFVLAPRTADAARAVAAAGGEITHRLPVVDGVGALLTRQQLARLQLDSTLRVTASSAGGSGRDYDKKARRTPYPTQVGADRLHDAGLLGTGRTV